jgi:hypothetical protein
MVGSGLVELRQMGEVKSCCALLVLERLGCVKIFRVNLGKVRLG